MVKVLMDESVERAIRRMREIQLGRMAVQDQHYGNHQSIGELLSCEKTIAVAERGPTSWDDFPNHGTWRCWHCAEPTSLNFSIGLSRPDLCKFCFRIQLEETTALAIRTVYRTTGDPVKVWRMLREAKLNIPIAYRQST